MAGARPILARGEEFINRHARLVERRLYEHAFRGGSAEAVVVAVGAYRNDDGGLGHALEPDLRVPSSQPIYVDYGLALLVEAGATDAKLIRGVCRFLSSTAREDGAVPYALPEAVDHPRADHWNGDYALAPSLHATTGVCGKLHALGARDEWLDRATAWCIAELEGRPEYAAHRILNAMEFVRHLPARETRDRLWAHVTGRLFEADYVALDTPVTSYGLVPLRFAPTPDHPARALFDDATIERHLDYMAEQQHNDGGWPLLWEPPTGAAVNEWRGRWTLTALLILRAYGRL